MVSLQDKHSFSIPVSASNVVCVDDESQLSDITWTDDSFILGEGSNTVFMANFSGQLLVNRLRGHYIEEVEGGVQVTLAAGENWHHWVKRLISSGYGGFENLALIPGSVGAAPVQNIGAYGVEVGQFIVAVRGVDLRTQQAFSFTQQECQFGYRHSIFKTPGYESYFITEVSFHLPADWNACLDYPDLAMLAANASPQEVFDHVVKVRQQKLPDPSVLPNAGSFFKNPVVSRDKLRRLLQRYPDIRYFELDAASVKLAAAWLIDQAGLKSLRIGGAGVHQRQALVLVNVNQASGNDLLSLATQVRKQIKQRFDVELEPEVRLLDERGPVQL